MGMDKKIKLDEYEKYLESDNWFNYAGFYDHIINEYDFETFVEVGVWKGHSVTYLAKGLKERELPNIKVYAVDLWDETYKYDGVNHGTKELYEQRKYLYEIYNTNVVNAGVRDLINDIKECSWEAAANFEDESLDFVFIDAGHDYDEVIKDIEAWLPKIKPNGIISGHDYANTNCGVKEAVDYKFSKFPIYSEGICWMVKKKDIK